MLTYGNPAYYARVGFQPVLEEVVPAPFRLRHPEGWQGQSLSGGPVAPQKPPCRPVAAFDDPRFW